MASSPDGLIAQLLSNQGINGAGQAYQAAQNNALAQAGAQQQLQAGALELQQKQAQQQQAQQYQADVNSFVQRGANPQEFFALAAKYPQQAKGLVDASKYKDEAAQTADLTYNSSLYNAATNKRTDLVQKQLNDRRTALANAGQPTDAIDDVLKQFATDPEGALNNVKGIALSKIYANKPDDFAKAFNIGPQKIDDEFSNTPQGTIYSKRTGEAKSGPGIAAPATIPTSLPDIADRIASIEGTGQNGSSTASGYGQFTNPTWISTYKSQFPNSGLTDAQILSKKGDPSLSKQLLGTLTTQNATALQNGGIEPTAPNVYLAHFLGPAGALAVLHSDPSTPIKNVVAQASINANPTVLGGNKTVGDLQNWATNKIQTAAPNSGASANPEVLSKDATTLLAQQYLSGDKSVFTNLGRGKQGAQNVVAVREEIAKQARGAGLNGRDIAAQMAQFSGDLAASRAAGTRLAQVETAANEANRLIPIALRTSNILDRAGWVPFAKIQQAIRNGSNDPKYRAFNAANNALVNAYSRAVSPTGTPTVQDKQHAYDLLNTTFDKTSYEATVNQMKQEIDAALKAPADTRAGIRSAITGQPVPAANNSTPSGPPAGSRQVGTYQGKPVYQLPNGKRVVAQ